MLLTRNLVRSAHQHQLMDGDNFKFVSFLNTKLWSSKFTELDVCGRPLFANPVTYTKTSNTNLAIKVKQFS